MEFMDLLAEIQKLKLDEIRTASGSFFECVVKREILPSVCGVLETYFGPPMKPEGKNPSREAEKLAAPYGGVRKNQTLYCKELGQEYDAAMFWPWSDGSLITIKMFRQAKPS